MDNKGKTIKQIADELGVSKQAVHQKRKKNPLSTALQAFTTTVDGVVYISVDGENLLKQAFSANESKQKQIDASITVNNDVLEVLKSTIDTLQHQLEVKDEQLLAKDKQIDSLNERFAEAQHLLDQEQKLHAGTIQFQLTDGEQPNIENVKYSPEPTKKSWKWWKK